MMPIIGHHRDWIQGAIRHPGALHRALDVPVSKPIPPAKMAEAKDSDDAHLRRMAAFATMLKSFRGR